MEEKLFKAVQAKFEIALESNPIIEINTNQKVFIKPDFYSKEHHVIGEIHVHAGRLKGGQPDKIASDILKMLLHDKIKDCIFQKYIVVCDEAEQQQLTGDSALAEAIRQFGIQVLLIPLEKSDYIKLQTVMKEQDFYQRTE